MFGRLLLSRIPTDSSSFSSSCFWISPFPASSIMRMRSAVRATAITWRPRPFPMGGREGGGGGEREREGREGGEKERRKSKKRERGRKRRRSWEAEVKQNLKTFICYITSTNFNRKSCIQVLYLELLPQWSLVNLTAESWLHYTVVGEEKEKWKGRRDGKGEVSIEDSGKETKSEKVNRSGKLTRLAHKVALLAHNYTSHHIYMYMYIITSTTPGIQVRVVNS